MYNKPAKDDIVRPTGGLGGLGHVDRKNPAPRPAPRELINGVRNKPPINLSNSPYANTNNSPPNFQTPMMERSPAPQIPQNMGATHDLAATGAITGRFPWKKALFVATLGGLAFGGYTYTRNRSLEEFEADVLGDDD